ncbi:MAG: carboxypeptidase regulatory-like domain-containing protein, partial [Bryobacteraceae bacterium]|nr:carboxypeptidase regulatory-like domain-containing protein [Bryobacteraceae bacterium]
MRYLCLLLACAAILGAQSFQGSLRGRITDPNGAAVPLVKVTLIDEGTSLSRATLTSEQGEYTFAAVNPATYKITVESPGFSVGTRSGVVVSTQTTVTVDIRLELGAVSEQVNVMEEAPAIETASASTGQVVDRQKLIDLP